MKNSKNFEELKISAKSNPNTKEVLVFIQAKNQMHSALIKENIPVEKLTQFFEDVKQKAITISEYSNDELKMYKKLNTLVENAKKNSSILLFSEQDIYFFIEWFYKDKNFYYFQNDEDAIDGNIEVFCSIVEKYRNNALAKQAIKAFTKIYPKVDNKNASTQDLINRTTEKLKKVKHDLRRKGVTEKSKQLLTLIDDFFENPKDYFPPTLNIKANNEEIREFFNSLKMPSQAQKELIDNLNFHQ